MLVIAGPPGSGKSTFRPVPTSPYDAFNLDERRAYLNNGSYQNLPATIRRQADNDFEAFIGEHIHARRSFAFETTLAREVTFQQAEEAHGAGFRLRMEYLATDTVRENITRIAARVGGGGHGTSPSKLTASYNASLANLPRALELFDGVRAFDNTQRWARPRLVLEAQRGRLKYLAPDTPSWVREALRGSGYDLAATERDPRFFRPRLLALTPQDLEARAAAARPALPSLEDPSGPDRESGPER